jgi:uncharacterized protein (TIGR03067 family)
MKQFYVFAAILITLFCSSFSPSSDPKFSIIGKWSTLDEKGNIMSFTFKEDGHYEMSTPEGTQKTDKKAELTYVFDQTKSPIWIDLIMKNKKDERMTLVIKGIVEIVDQDNIKMNMGGDERPSDFFGKKVAAFQRTSKK